MKRTALSLLECGHCRQIEAMTMRGAPWRIAEYPSLVGVIEHPQEGVILFDTGYDEAFLQATGPLPERLYRWTTPVTIAPGAGAANQLAARGIQPEDVRHIVISHFHGDHVAGLARFPQARLHCSRVGLDDLRSHGRIGRVRHGLLANLVPHRIRDAAFFEADRSVELPTEFRPFNRGSDILGDGSLIAVELPGHCPGHWGLALRAEDDRHVMMVADAAWSIAAIERDTPPPAFTAGLLGDAATHRRTLSSLHALHGTGAAVLLPSHCRAAASGSGFMS